MSRLTLAVDTTHEWGSLALIRGDVLIEEVGMHAPTGFGHVLYGHLGELLERHGLRVGDVDCFAAASGPGSFTGVRVGLACVKGLAEATGKPAVAVSNLRALSTFGTAALRAVVMDARRGEVYGAVYDAGARLVTAEVVSPLAAWMESLPAGDLEFVSADLELAGVRLVAAPRELAGAIARLAASEAGADAAALDANYVRRSDAEVLWKEY